jgi:hypothetical protein
MLEAVGVQQQHQDLSQRHVVSVVRLQHGAQPARLAAVLMIDCAVGRYNR